MNQHLFHYLDVFYATTDKLVWLVQIPRNIKYLHKKAKDVTEMTAETVKTSNKLTDSPKYFKWNYWNNFIPSFNTEIAIYSS